MNPVRTAAEVIYCAQQTDAAWAALLERVQAEFGAAMAEAVHLALWSMWEADQSGEH